MIEKDAVLYYLFVLFSVMLIFGGISYVKIKNIWGVLMVQTAVGLVALFILAGWLS